MVRSCVLIVPARDCWPASHRWEMSPNGGLLVPMNEERYGIAGYGSSSYGDAFADVYDSWYASLDDDDFAQYIASLLPDHTSTVLELGVGTGRLLDKLVHLRQHRDHIFGIDSSQAMLERLNARENLAHVSTICGDFSQQLPNATFDLIFVGYNTLFNLPDNDALSSCLSLVHSRLSPKGLFALDVVVPEAESTPETVALKSITTDHVTLSVSRHDHEQQRIIGQFIDITNSGSPTLRPWSVRYWTPSQLDDLALAAGLKLVTRIADGHGSTHCEDDARHISVYTVAQ